MSGPRALIYTTVLTNETYLGKFFLYMKSFSDVVRTILGNPFPAGESHHVKGSHVLYKNRKKPVLSIVFFSPNT